MFKLKKAFYYLLEIMLLVGLMLAIRFGPMMRTFEFNYDEGLNLIKVLLYSQGFSLYSQIWNDQPPLFTVFLSQWFNLFGQSVFAARLLVLLFSALLVWCFYRVIRITVGTIPALISALLLLFSWQFIDLSTAVMIGIPSLSLAMVSVYFLVLYRHYLQNYFIILSGIAFALSLQTKLFTAFLIPLIIFYLLGFKLDITLIKKNHVKSIYPIMQWLITIAAFCGLIGLLYQEFLSSAQTFQSHLNQPLDQEQPVIFDNPRVLRYLIKQDIDYLFAATIGILIILFKRQRAGFLPILWLGTATLILLRHKPIWYHYYPLLAIPICWLIAYTIAFVLDALAKGWHRNLKPLNFRKVALPGLAAVILIGLIVVSPTNPLFGGPTPENVEITQRLLKYKQSTNWVFTDRPMYAFRAGLRVPPEIAVISFKRFNSGNLTSINLLTTLEKYRPEQIVLARWASKIRGDSKLAMFINQNYSKTYSNQDSSEEHYLLKSS